MAEPAHAKKTDLFGLGRLVLDKGLATRQQVERCLGIQRENADSGVFLKLGEIFVREGILSPEQVQALLALQHVKILICVRCFAQFNVEDWSPERTDNCPRCNAALVEPSDLKSLAVEDTVSDTPAPTEVKGLAIMDNSVRQFGKYDILGEISRGGMGIVYKARQRELDRIVALKVLLAGGESSREQVRRFQREARAVARLRHPNIIGIHEIGEHRGIHFFSMDYISGVALDKLFGRPEVGRDALIEMIRAIADAVECAHGVGVLHRDIKPSNILVTANEEPYLIDFGIARTRLDESKSRLTRQGYIFGSPLYMAPEYVAGKLPEFDVRCDVYALGVVLYQVLAGVTPYEDVETIHVLSRILKEEAVPVEDVADNVGNALATICAKAIDRDPRKRYQSAAALSEDLRRYLAGETIMARPRPMWQRWWVRNRRTARWVGVLVAAVLVAFGAWYYPTLNELFFAEVTRERDDTRRELVRVNQLVRDQRKLLIETTERLWGLGRKEEALRLIDQVIAREPEVAQLHFVRAQLLDDMGRQEDAQEALRRAQELDPEITQRHRKGDGG